MNIDDILKIYLPTGPFDIDASTTSASRDEFAVANRVVSTIDSILCLDVGDIGPARSPLCVSRTG